VISFNIPPHTGREESYMQVAIASGKISGDGIYTKKVHEYLEQCNGRGRALLTTSGTHALEMAAILSNIGVGDEVIMPSYTFVSTANAFVLQGARPIFVDIRPDTMNINEMLIEHAITEKTKAIVPVHYAGVSCEMDTIMAIARKHKLLIIEDAAQGVAAKYKERTLGSIGDFGCYSFHETKNFSMGEGGAIMINEDFYFENAEIIREKGTNRSRFFRGQVDKYTWVSKGSSYLPSDLNAAYLFAQLEQMDSIQKDRLRSWNLYYELLQPLAVQEKIVIPTIPPNCEHNGHMFYIKLGDIEERTRMIDYLLTNDILSVFHYVPLHSSKAGMLYGEFCGEDIFTTKESERLLRLPMYFGLTEKEILYITDKIKSFFN
jgi:dTDP-4-amino-4,6-dideoxygalactose transaminase